MLVCDEIAESFEWVFSEFLRVMGGAPPMTILTDHIQPMELTIKEHYARHHTPVVQVSRAQEGKVKRWVLCTPRRVNSKQSPMRW